MTSRRGVLCRREQALAARSRSNRPAILPDPRPIELANPRHVGSNVVGRVEQRAEADRLLGIMEIGGKNRHAGLARDVPESRFPFLYFLARAFGREREPEAVV